MDTGLTYFDCYTTIGPRQAMYPGEPYTLNHLQKSLDLCGIDAALVCTTLSENYDVMWGNNWLCDQLHENPRLFPVWTAMPEHTGEVPEPAVFINMAKKRGVKAVRLYPRSQSFSPTPLSIGNLMQELAAAKMPVLISMDEFISSYKDQTPAFERFAEFLSYYPKNKIIALDLRWNQWRFVLPLLEKFKNLHMEFSSFQANIAPEFLVKKFGSSRLLFGSDSPLKSAGAARSFIDWAGVSKKDRGKIACGNLQKLLGIKKVPVFKKKPADDIMKACWQGKQVEMVEVLDSHAHINHDGAQGVGYITQFDSDVKSMKKLFHKVGIQKTAFSSWLGIYAPEPVMGNDITFSAMQSEPDFAIGYACIDPNRMTAKEIKHEIDLRYNKQGFLGLKPYVRTRAKFDDPRYTPWYKFADKNRLFGLFHGSADIAAKLAKKYKNMTFLLAHSGGSVETADINSNYARDLPNVFCEITLTSVTNGAIELMVKKAGAEKVLFGTDAPMRDPRPQLGWVVHADISRSAKQKILGGNFKKILKQCRLPGNAKNL
ncbi:MAG: amidohydrolase family protein [Planctomycetota bacterium]|jgi:predicted TIM-barrel fold metal-dependent hydrolase